MANKPRACDLCGKVSEGPDDYECPICSTDHNACCLDVKTGWCVRCAELATDDGK